MIYERFLRDFAQGLAELFRSSQANLSSGDNSNKIEYRLSDLSECCTGPDGLRMADWTGPTGIYLVNVYNIHVFTHVIVIS